MNIAIIGAGLAGLSLCYHLQKSGLCSVTVFDGKGVGGGASAVASGLVHPYVGEQVRRSVMGSEAIEGVEELLQAVEPFIATPFVDRSGIERLVDTIDQQEQMHSHASVYGDVVHLGGPRFLITSGITVHTELYLHGLYSLCRSLGAHFEKQDIQDLSSLSSFDVIVIAAGAGSTSFKEIKPLKLSATRGQLLICSWPEDLPALPRSLVGKGYIAKSVDPSSQNVSIGSTYERGRCDDTPDENEALSLITPKSAALCPELTLTPSMVKAGVRLTPKGHYLPLVGRLDKRLWLMTGFGSRGLLYHGLFGRYLSEAILSSDESILPEPLLRQLSNNKGAMYNGS